MLYLGYDKHGWVHMSNKPRFMLQGKISRGDKSVYQFKEIISLTQVELVKAVDSLITNNCDADTYEFTMVRYYKAKG